jgi:hypothetical protein
MKKLWQKNGISRAQNQSYIYDVRQSRELKKPWQKNGVSRARNLAHAEATVCSAEHYRISKKEKPQTSERNSR